MSLITLPEAEHSAPGAQALIAAARAHARRRRLKVAAALVALAISAAVAVLIGRPVSSTHAAAQLSPRPALPAAGTGIVTGQLSACFGVVPQNGPLPVTPGTVVVLRGVLTWKPDGPGTWRLVYPPGPAVASEHISDNYHQTFRFALPPGHYVLAGRYGSGPGFATFRQVTVTVGAAIRVDLPNVCE
jgi:hypothetical protein